MKKFYGLILAIVCLIVATGCGNSSKNEITCTTTEDGQKVEVTVKTNSDDKIVSLKMITEIEASSKEELDETYDFMNSSLTEINKTAGVKVGLSKKDLKLIMSMDIDLSKVSDEIKDSLNIGDEFDVTGTEFRKNAEKDGAICK